MSKRISQEDADRIMRRHSAAFHTLLGVFSVGVEKDLSGEFLLKIGVDRELPIPTLPDELEGLKVVVEPLERPRKLAL